MVYCRGIFSRCYPLTKQAKEHLSEFLVEHLHYIQRKMTRGSQENMNFLLMCYTILMKTATSFID